MAHLNEQIVSERHPQSRAVSRADFTASRYTSSVLLAQTRHSIGVHQVYSREITPSSIASDLIEYKLITMRDPAMLQIDCLLEPLLAWVQDGLLPQLPALVYSLGATFHHLNVRPRQGTCPSNPPDMGLLC